MGKESAQEELARHQLNEIRHNEAEERRSEREERKRAREEKENECNYDGSGGFGAEW